jgi:intracellular sulfur oxidation DsrE/DsrF family protein
VVRLLSTNKDGFPSEEHEIIDNIADIITAMAKDGIKMEICLYATKAFGIESDSILPELEQILNGWLSVIGYQAKHYSLLQLKSGTVIATVIAHFAGRNLARR